MTRDLPDEALGQTLFPLRHPALLLPSIELGIRALFARTVDFGGLLAIRTVVFLLTRESLRCSHSLL